MSDPSSRPPRSSGALVRDNRHREPWREPEWQRLWLSVQRQTWASLALIPAGKGAPVDFTLTVAVILARTSMVHLGVPVQVADATRVPLARLTALLDQIRQCNVQGDRVLVALPPAKESPVASSIAHAADASLLCVLLDAMLSSDAKETVAQIGANNFLGSAIFHPDRFGTP